VIENTCRNGGVRIKNPDLSSMASINNFGSMTIVQLKEELGRRGAKKSGRKEELVKR
jgi:hypothetical protein